MSPPADNRAMLEVLRPGLCTLVVDAGRPRTRSLGVPVGGPADPVAFALGNALVGNRAGEAALEITLTGPALRADRPLAGVLFGAPFTLSLSAKELIPGHTFTLEPGATLDIGGTPAGARAYLCVAGGIHTPVILDSRCSLQPLAVGDLLPCRSGTTAGRFLAENPHALPEGEVVLRYLDGPHAPWFPPGRLDGSAWSVSPASNRMGLRLQGEALPVPDRELVSEPVCPGTVQVMRDGQCVVLGVDGQTIGGYPKIAQVIAADVGLLGQLAPGSAVRFARTTLEQAEAAYRDQQQELRRCIRRVLAAGSPS